MEKGALVECGPPEQLLAQPGSRLSEMMRHAAVVGASAAALAPAPSWAASGELPLPPLAPTQLAGSSGAGPSPFESSGAGRPPPFEGGRAGRPSPFGDSNCGGLAPSPFGGAADGRPSPFADGGGSGLPPVQPQS